MKKKLNLRIEEIARIEINEAYLWYEKQSIGLGDKFIKAFDRALNTIQKSPNGFEEYDRHRQCPLKKFPFVILYEVTEETLYVDAVFHTSRNPDDKAR